MLENQKIRAEGREFPPVMEISICCQSIGKLGRNQSYVVSTLDTMCYTENEMRYYASLHVYSVRCSN